MSSPLRDAEHWRKLAGEARAQAEQMPSQEAKRQLLKIAETYEELAKIAADKKHQEA